MNIRKHALGVSACLALGAAGFAAVIVDDNGLGFVGKGDVQLAFGWHNAQFQQCLNSAAADSATDAGCLRFNFAVIAMTSETTEWECWKVNNAGKEIRHERSSTLTITTNSTRVSAAVARSRNQVTGINLNGGVPSESVEIQRDGPEASTCPPGWNLDADTVVSDTIDLGSIASLKVTDTRTDTTHALTID